MYHLMMIMLWDWVKISIKILWQVCHLEQFWGRFYYQIWATSINLATCKMHLGSVCLIPFNWRSHWRKICFLISGISTFSRRLGQYLRIKSGLFLHWRDRTTLSHWLNLTFGSRCASSSKQVVYFASLPLLGWAFFVTIWGEFWRQLSGNSLSGATSLLLYDCVMWRHLLGWFKQLFGPRSVRRRHVLFMTPQV